LLDRDGFLKHHEISDSATARTTVGEMLDSLEKRTGSKAGATVVGGSRMAYEEDLARDSGAWYFTILWPGRQPERNAWLGEFEQSDDWKR